MLKSQFNTNLRKKPSILFLDMHVLHWLWRIYPIKSEDLFLCGQLFLCYLQKAYLCVESFANLSQSFAYRNVESSTARSFNVGKDYSGAKFFYTDPISLNKAHSTK